MTELAAAGRTRKVRRYRRIAIPAAQTVSKPAQRAIKEAEAAGLLESDTVHFSFRVPKALVAAAKREAGIESNTDLGRAALAMLAQADPFAEFFKRTEGTLGSDFTLEY